MHDEENKLFHTDPKPFIFTMILLFIAFLMVMHVQYQEEDTHMSFIEYVFFNDEPTSAEISESSASYKE